MKVEQIMKNWQPGGIIRGILKEGALFDQSPLM